MSAYNSTRQMRKLLPRYSDLLLAAMLLVVAVYVGCDVLPQVRFDRERIEVWAAPQQIQVSGLYHYENPSSLPAFFSLGLPFPVDDDHPRPTIYAVSESSVVDDRVVIPLPTTGQRTVTFRVFLKPHAGKWVRVDYIQWAGSSRGRYILTTTRRWHHPLEHGDYILHLAPGTELSNSNYPLTAGDATNIFSFSKSNFYPDQDWEFAWQQRDSNSIAESKR